MQIVQVFDNGGITIDRYLIVFDTGDALACSENPDSPQGVSQWVEYSYEVVNTVVYDPSIIDSTELPKNVLEHVLLRSTERG